MERSNYGDSRRYEDDDDGYTDAFPKQQERVDNHADYAKEDSTETDLHEKLGHKSRKHHGKGGKFVSPHTGEYSAPVFVPVAKFQDQGNV